MENNEGRGVKPEAVKIRAEHFDNLYKLNHDLYRSEQPGHKGMEELEKLGVKTVLNLRNRLNDRGEAKGTGLHLLHLPINTWKMDYYHVVEALRLLLTAEKPVVVHCLHGSDRTGVVIAAYRMVIEGWAKEKAIAEFKEERFGYHEKWFPKILTLLETLDKGQLKKDIY